MFRRHLSYANVVATMALVFAMSGGALAASHYLITSTKQIKPSVLKALKGKAGHAGPIGPAGPTGATGQPGSPGSNGAPGTFSTTLASGQTVRGAYNTGGTAAAANALANTSISFITLLSAAPTAVIVKAGATPPAECPGSVAVPEAKPGFLCIYEQEHLNTPTLQINGTAQSGATVFVESEATERFFSFGTWAVTAP